VAQKQSRPRKRRGGRNRNRGAATRPPAADAAWRESVQEARKRPAPTGPAAGAKPERPRPPWHPLPLSEVLILVGAVALVVGLGRGTSTGGRTPLLLGVVAVGIGTIEFTLREHRSGFRSHTILLALLPVVVFHTAVVLIVSAFTPVTRAITFVTLIGDVAVFAISVRLLRSHWREARHAKASRLVRR
jgi:hypothetical protein